MLRSELFVDAFRDKGPMKILATRVPVKVILNADSGLLGAAVHAQSLGD
jgi:glucokinase